jgi:Ca2+-binding EF-hand superfamily protein
MKTKKKDNKRKNIIKLFNKYDKNKNGLLSEKDMIKLIKNEYKESHSKNIINGLMSIWGIKIDKKLYINKDTFIKLYISDMGFFRHKTI